LTSGAARSIRMVVKHLYEAIQERVTAWRANRYSCPEFPTIGEILECSRASWSRGFHSQSSS